ncbi:MAG: ATP-binding cassette domain-containing protein [Bilophila wadsworthia]
MLGGVDVRKLPLSQVMQSVAYVSQDNFLFNVSLRENIRLGRPDATDREVEEAAEAAACGFIKALPGGYDTPAGDAGARLSGGERQRIAIARAMLKDSPIVVLDEATAFADPENEAFIQESISRLVKDKTLVVIAHRLSTIVRADRIVVMDGGRVSAVGARGTAANLAFVRATLGIAYRGTGCRRAEHD